MLIQSSLSLNDHNVRQRQSGMVLLLALIVMISMTLAGLGLMRSVGTATAITGNMAFQQAATMSGQSGVEEAIAWIEKQEENKTDFLIKNYPDRSFYVADALNTLTLPVIVPDPDPTQGKPGVRNGVFYWSSYWDDVWAKSDAPTRTPKKLDIYPDEAGNHVSYVIDRLCVSTGAINSATCSESPVNFTSAGSSQAAGGSPIQSVVQAYYRITVRIQGPRNTQSFIQAIIAR
ncbi:pilus assembly PilX family protein [Propionivibrio sp.]|uniref:pilus assembly PilX family protein n=1 Tax=Propionivibrio sp. TaxID=2212460 RepID=UPI003BEFA433